MSAIEGLTFQEFTNHNQTSGTPPTHSVEDIAAVRRQLLELIAPTCSNCFQTHDHRCNLALNDRSCHLQGLTTLGSERISVTSITPHPQCQQPRIILVRVRHNDATHSLHFHTPPLLNSYSIFSTNHCLCSPSPLIHLPYPL